MRSGLCNELHRAYGEEIIRLAYAADLRRDATLPARDIDAIDPKRAVFVTQDGAAADAFVVRLGLAEQAMHAVGLQPDEVHDDCLPTLYTVASDRRIPELRSDGTPNKERTIVAALAPDMLASGDTSEYGVRKAILAQQDFEPVAAPKTVGSFGTYQEWRKAGEFPRGVVHVKPHAVMSPVEMGLRIIDEVEAGGLGGRQVVMGHNCQHRTATDLMIRGAGIRGAWQHSGAPVVIGDEYGYTYSATVPHADGEATPLTFATPNRSPDAYLPEFAIIRHLAVFAPRRIV